MSEKFSATSPIHSQIKAFLEPLCDCVWLVDAGGQILYANPSVETNFGYAANDLLHKPFDSFCTPEQRSRLAKIWKKSDALPLDLNNLLLLTRSGKTLSIDLRITLSPFTAQQNVFFAVAQIHPEKDEWIQDKSLFSVFMNNLPGGAVFIKDSAGKVVYANKRMSDLFGGIDWVGKTSYDVFSKEQADSMTVDDQKALNHGLQVVMETVVDSDGINHIFVTYKFPIERKIGKPLLGVISTDVTDRKQAEEQIQRHLDHLTSLHAIDEAITTRLDLAVTMEILLEQILEQLYVNAAIVLVYNPLSQDLETAANKGLEQFFSKKISLKSEHNIITAAFHERRRIVNLDAIGDPALRECGLGEEGFSAYISMPLIAHGNILGVLLVLHRQPILVEPGWYEFLDKISGQAATAIDNALLFKNLQQSNATLRDAYDKTLEGWARALELRDQETEGHSQRLLDMTERLARAFNISEAEMPAIRQGALLHDIGKMAIPDQILLKPGPLTEEEWQVMKMHPVYSRVMLKKVDFLIPAIDIPYSHHERWDGTGYPQGLIGEQIPLAARIFAVVDVWDALRFNRPYRKGWPDEEVLKYIQEQSGRHFDPQIVNVFFSLLKKDTPG